jgi:hypothetical protein
MGGTRNEVFVVILVDECFGDFAPTQKQPLRAERLS